MTVFGISMVRDEADIIWSTVTNMLGQVDQVIVADNGSTDGTRDILDSLDVTVIDDPEIGYYQSAKMTRLAQLAAEKGADWVVPFDADEWWYSPFGTITDHLESVDTMAVTAELYDHVATGADPDKPDPTERIGWRRRIPAALPKIACRTRPYLTIEQGNHGAIYDGCRPITATGLTVRHFPYRSPEQFVRKARNGAEAYAATDLPTNQGAHWRDYGALLEAHGPEALEDVFRTWFWVADPSLDESLIYDPAP